VSNIQNRSFWKNQRFFPVLYLLHQPYTRLQTKRHKINAIYLWILHQCGHRRCLDTNNTAVTTTRGLFFYLTMHWNGLAAGLCPDHSTPPDSLVGFKGGPQERERRGGTGMKGGTERVWVEGRKEGWKPPIFEMWLHPCIIMKYSDAEKTRLEFNLKVLLHQSTITTLLFCYIIQALNSAQYRLHLLFHNLLS